jgi:hypothetical protein
MGNININVADLWKKACDLGYQGMRMVEGWLEGLLHINITWALLGLCALGAVAILVIWWLAVRVWEKFFLYI